MEEFLRAAKVMNILGSISLEKIEKTLSAE